MLSNDQWRCNQRTTDFYGTSLYITTLTTSHDNNVMALTQVQRVRIMLDLLKDGSVTTEANYSSPTLDYLDIPTALKYAEALITSYHSPGDVSGMSGEEKSRRVLNILRRIFREALTSTRGVAASSAEKVTASSEVDTEIGTEE